MTRKFAHWFPSLEDPPRTLEVRADKSVKGSDGHEGSWKMSGGKFEITVAGFTISRLRKSGKTSRSTLVNDASSQKFRMEIEKFGE